MAFLDDPRAAGLPRPGPALVIVLALIYLGAALVGHDPWKTEDAVHLGVAFNLFNGGDWRLPGLAGEPWPDAEPLYPMVAAALAWLTQAWLPFHDGARLATGLFTALYFAVIAAAARSLYGRGGGTLALLLALGTVGLVVPMHEAQPAVAALAANALAYWGAVRRDKTPLAAALMVGAGIGASFLFYGFAGALPVLILLFWPLSLGGRPALAALLALAAVALPWPLLLAWQFPEALHAWWGAELAALPGGFRVSYAHWELLAWALFPIAPLALWTLWLDRRKCIQAKVFLPLVGALAALLWFLLREPKPLPALPLATPLLLLAVPGLVRLRRGLASLFGWFSGMTFALAMFLVWLGSIALLTGWPPRLAANLARLEPGYAAVLSVPALVTALAMTVLWAAFIKIPRTPYRPGLQWALGVVSAWTLVTALWLPMIDYDKTYRPVAAELQGALGKHEGCINRDGIGSGQRASLDYFAGLRTVSLESRACPWLLTQVPAGDADPEGWQRVWEGHRPSDKTERLRLYRRP